MRKKVNKKLIVALLSFVLLFGGTFGSSLAWLLDDTTPVENTFSTSGIEIDLKETTSDYKMIPGWTIEKDPKVTVEIGSEACYVFVMIEKNENYDDYLENYVVDTAWTPLEDTNFEDEYLVSGTTTDGGTFRVYYQAIKTPVTETAWSDYVLQGEEHLETCEADEGETCECPNLNGYVTVKDSVKKENMKEVTANNPVTLTFTAYATQYWKNNTTPFGEYEAWKVVAPDTAKSPNP